MLALALLPTLAHALAHGQGVASRWVEVCTPQGMKQVAVDAAELGDAAAPAAALSATLERCADCTLSAPAAPPPAVVTLPERGNAAAYVPPLFLHAPRKRFAWCSAQPRAPPVGS